MLSVPVFRYSEFVLNVWPHSVWSVAGEHIKTCLSEYVLMLFVSIAVFVLLIYIAIKTTREDGYYNRIYKRKRFVHKSKN